MKNDKGQVTGEALLIACAAALVWYGGHEAVKGVKKVGKEGKKAGTAIVHVIKKVF